MNLAIKVTAENVTSSEEISSNYTEAIVINSTEEISINSTLEDVTEPIMEKNNKCNCRKYFFLIVII